MFFASNYFYAYQGAINTAVFDGPTRALNATLEGAGAIVGALFIGYCVLDLKWFHRRTRGYIGIGVVTTLTIIIWAVALSWQVTFTRATTNAKDFVKINYKDSNYKGKGALFFFCELRCWARFEVAEADSARSLLCGRVLPGARVLDHVRDVERPVHARAVRGAVQGAAVRGLCGVVRDGRGGDAVLERAPGELADDARVVPVRVRGRADGEGDEL